ncbi:unnamed protein product [Pylaiella littoralis]
MGRYWEIVFARKLLHFFSYHIFPTYGIKYSIREHCRESIYIGYYDSSVGDEFTDRQLVLYFRGFHVRQAQQQKVCAGCSTSFRREGSWQLVCHFLRTTYNVFAAVYCSSQTAL